VRDLAVSGRPVTLVWLRRRFACDNCGQRHLEVHDEFEGRLTRRMVRQVVADAKVMSVRAVARRHRISWAAAMDLISLWSALVAARRRARRCRVLLVDETSMRRRHRYVTVQQDGETGAVIAMVPHRNQAALAGFFLEQGRRWCAGVRVVVRAVARAVGDPEPAEPAAVRRRGTSGLKGSPAAPPDAAAASVSPLTVSDPARTVRSWRFPPSRSAAFQDRPS
jgi:hypothetical protein